MIFVIHTQTSVGNQTKKSASLFPFQGCNGEDVDYDYDHQQAI